MGDAMTTRNYFRTLLAISLAFSAGCAELTPGGQCGDGNVDLAEVCDDGNTTDGDGCSADCQSDETCGNLIVDTSVGEECDDGNTLSGDACQETCLTPICGDGIVDVGERCDGSPSCLPTCDGFMASCSDVLASDSMAADGTYALDFDGAGPLKPTVAYCDLTTDGGGWMLTLKVLGGSPVGPWFDPAMAGDDSGLPTSLGIPTSLSEGPLLADRGDIAAAISATQYRASRYDAAASLIMDIASSHMATTGMAVRCFAMGGADCDMQYQNCSPSDTDARVIGTDGSTAWSVDDTGYLCDIGWVGCSSCVDWSELSGSSSAGNDPDAVFLVGDDFNLTSSDYSLFWVR